MPQAVMRVLTMLALICTTTQAGHQSGDNALSCPKEQPICSGREGMLHKAAATDGHFLKGCRAGPQAKEKAAKQVCCWVVKTHLEEVVTGHARLPGHAGRDDDQVSILEGCCQLVIASVALQKQVVGGQRELGCLVVTRAECLYCSCIQQLLWGARPASSL